MHCDDKIVCGMYGNKRISKSMQIVSHLIKAITILKYKTMVNKVTKFTLGDMTFGTKKQLREFVSTWLYDGYKVDMDADPWILDLLTMHPRATKKMENMVGLHVHYSMPFYCFVVDKADGTTEDISYTKCLTGDSKNQRIYAAFRHAISDQIYAFKKALFKNGKVVICPISGLNLGDNPDTHIDHNFDIMPFKQLIVDFCSKYGYEFENIHVTSEKTIVYITDVTIKHEFMAYHAKYAVLRGVHKSANLTETKTWSTRITCMQ